MDLCGAVGTLPLYRLYRKNLRFFGKTQVEQFVVGEPRNAFAEFILDEDPDLVNFAQRTLAELAEIQNRWWKRKGPEEGTSGPADAGAAFEALCGRGEPGQTHRWAHPGWRSSMKRWLFRAGTGAGGV